MIRGLPVVEDPRRTKWSGDRAPADDQDGAWQFGRLMADLVGNGNDQGATIGHPFVYTPASPSTFVRKWLEMWATDDRINCDPVPARPAVVTEILDKWPKLGNGDLDLTKAPPTGCGTRRRRTSQSRD